MPKWNRLMWWAMRHDAVLQELVNFCDLLSSPGSMQTDYWNLLRCWSYVSIETYKRPYSDLLRSWLRYIGKEVKMRICWVPRLRAFVTTNLRSFLWWDHRWAWSSLRYLYWEGCENENLFKNLSFDWIIGEHGCDRGMNNHWKLLFSEWISDFCLESQCCRKLLPTIFSPYIICVSKTVRFVNFWHEACQELVNYWKKSS